MCCRRWTDFTDKMKGCLVLEIWVTDYSTDHFLREGSSDASKSGDRHKEPLKEGLLQYRKRAVLSNIVCPHRPITHLVQSLGVLFPRTVFKLDRVHRVYRNNRCPSRDWVVLSAMWSPRSNVGRGWDRQIATVFRLVAVIDRRFGVVLFKNVLVEYGTSRFWILLCRTMKEIPHIGNPIVAVADVIIFLSRTRWVRCSPLGCGFVEISRKGQVEACTTYWT